jgi:hypothetical protein
MSEYASINYKVHACILIHQSPIREQKQDIRYWDADASPHPDIGLVHPILPEESAKNIFYFFAFAGAQCREHQRLPLKFAEFMDGRELLEAIIREVSSDGPPYELEVHYDDDDNMFFKGGWPCFAEDYNLHQG